jgi:hypothetical protein
LLKVKSNLLRKENKMYKGFPRKDSTQKGLKARATGHYLYFGLSMQDGSNRNSGGQQGQDLKGPFTEVMLRAGDYSEMIVSHGEMLCRKMRKQNP